MTIERGPNVNLDDLNPDVRDDPMFTSWRDPVPPEWFSANQRAYVLVDQDALYGSLSFAKYLSRSGSDTVTTPSDSATRTIVYSRTGNEVLDTPIETSSSGPTSSSSIGVSAIGADPLG